MAKETEATRVKLADLYCAPLLACFGKTGTTLVLRAGNPSCTDSSSLWI